MEEVFHGSIWKTVGPMLATDDVVRLRVAASRWNKGDWYGPLGRVFFNMLALVAQRQGRQTRNFVGEEAYPRLGEHAKR